MDKALDFGLGLLTLSLLTRDTETMDLILLCVGIGSWEY